MATYYSNWYQAPKAPSIKLRMKIVTSYSQNITNNSSTVTAKQYIESKDYVAYLPDSPGGITEEHKLVISGTTYTSSGSKEYTGQTVLIQTRTKTINHNANGVGSFSVSGSCSAVLGNDYGSSVSATMSISSKSVSLPTINRVSTITSNATNNTKFGDEITFAISRYNSNFTHNLSYKMYSATGTIATGVGTSYRWTIPTSLIANSPDNAQPSITITCVTKNGSTTIGSDTYSFKVKVPSEYVPTCQLNLVDEGVVPSAWGVWVKSKSKVKGIITTGTSIAGDTATIKSYLAKANDNTFMINPFLTDFLKNSGERTATVTVTDTRDRTASAEQTIEVIDYFPPTISMCKVERCDSNGTLNEEGTFGKATVEFKIAPVNELNEKKVKVSYGSIEKEVTLSEYEGIYVFTELFENLENNASYNFEFELIDSFDSIPQTYTLSPSFVTQSLFAGGRGVTFGQTAVKEGLQVHMDAEFHKDTFANNLNISGLKIEKSNDEWRFYIDE
jgi:hypothetical protein